MVDRLLTDLRAEKQLAHEHGSRSHRPFVPGLLLNGALGHCNESLPCRLHIMDWRFGLEPQLPPEYKQVVSFGIDTGHN